VALIALERAGACAAAWTTVFGRGISAGFLLVMCTGIGRRRGKRKLNTIAPRNIKIWRSRLSRCDISMVITSRWTFASRKEEEDLQGPRAGLQSTHHILHKSLSKAWSPIGRICNNDYDNECETVKLFVRLCKVEWIDGGDDVLIRQHKKLQAIQSNCGEAFRSLDEYLEARSLFTFTRPSSCILVRFATKKSQGPQTKRLSRHAIVVKERRTTSVQHGLRLTVPKPCLPSSQS